MKVQRTNGRKTKLSQGLINVAPAVIAIHKSQKGHHKLTLEQVSMAMERNPTVQEKDGVVLWVESGDIWEEALIFRGERTAGSLAIWRRKRDKSQLYPVGFNGALNWLQEAYELDERGLVQVKTWEPLAAACLFHMLRFRNLENLN